MSEQLLGGITCEELSKCKTDAERLNLFKSRGVTYLQLYTSLLKSNGAKSVELYRCYYCVRDRPTSGNIPYETISKRDYKTHILTQHRQGPCFPTKADLKKYGLEAQGRTWEK